MYEYIIKIIKYLIIICLIMELNVILLNIK